MKNSILVIVLAVCLVLAFSASAFAIGPFFKITSVDGSANNNFSNYLSWGYASTNASFSPDNVGSPHGNYTTATNKCAICHAVHRADSAGTVLTAIDLTSLTYTKGCAFCHAAGGSGFSVKTAVMGTDGSISPHTDCSRCHIESPHGAGASGYTVLSARLINTNADDQIAEDIANKTNGMDTVDMMDANNALALTLGTGYLCDNCHFQTAVPGQQLAFPVNTIDATVSVGDVGAGDTNPSSTGHRVYAAATTTWNQAGEFNAYYSGGGAPGATSQIAFDGAQGCDTCHDAKDANGNNAFPHGYVDAAGDYTTKTTAGGSLVWLTTGADAGAARTVLGTLDGGTSAANENGVNNLLSEDGLCLKCHIDAGGAAGVGINF